MKCFVLLSGIVTIALLSSCKHREVPKPDHVIIVIEENHGYDQVVGSPNAPYLNELVAGSAVFTDSHGVTHPSQGNYLAFFSGNTHGITNDKCLMDETPYVTPNLGAALIDNGYTFKGFAQSMPSVGYLECRYQKSDITGGTVYARKHAPWVNWQGDKKNNIPASASQPMTAFPKDFDQLPTVAFVIPDQDHDMHNIGAPGDSAALKRGDDWLKENLSAYVDWAKTHNSLLILTYDEDESSTTQNHILTLFSGPMVKPGKYDEKINHYNVLNTLETMYDLPTDNSANFAAIKDVWKK